MAWLLIRGKHGPAGYAEATSPADDLGQPGGPYAIDAINTFLGKKCREYGDQVG